MLICQTNIRIFYQLTSFGGCRGGVVCRMQVGRPGLLSARLFLADDHDAKGAGYHFRSLVCGGGLFEIRGGEEDFVEIFVDSDRPRAPFGREIAQYGECFARAFFDDAEDAFAAGCKNVLQLRVESDTVAAIADGQGSHDLTVGGIHHYQGLVATGEKTFGLQVYGEAGRAFGGSKRPTAYYVPAGKVDDGNLVFIFDIYKDPAGAIGNGCFGFAADGYGGDDFIPGGVYEGEVVAAAIAGDDQFRKRFEEDGVGVLAGGNLGEDLVGFQIEYGDGIEPAVAGITLACRGIEGDTMDPGRIGDDAYGIPRRLVQYIHLAAMRDVYTVIARSCGDIVPSARTGNGEICGDPEPIGILSV